MNDKPNKNQNEETASIGPINGQLDIATREESNGVVIIDLNGVIVTKSRKQLQEKVEDLLEEEKTHIALNFSDVAHLDSTGMGTLLLITNLVKKKGKRLKIFAANQMIGRFFQTSGLHRVLSLYPDENAALKDDWDA